MVYTGTDSADSGGTGSESTASATTASDTGGFNVVEAADRFATILAPFTDLIAVVVNALTAVTLMRKL